MSKKIEINVELNEKPVRMTKAVGSVAVITIGERRVRFIMQTEIDGKECSPTLVHIPSGLVAVNAAQISAEQLRAIATTGRITARQAAGRCINSLVERTSAEHVLSVMDKAKVIN